MADYTTAAQIIIDPNLSSDEKILKLREFEQTGKASYNTPAPSQAPEVPSQAPEVQYTPPQTQQAPQYQYDPIEPYVLETDPLGIPGTGIPPRPLPAGGIQTGPTPMPPTFRDDGSLTVMGLRQARLLKANPPGILGAATGGGAGRPRLYAGLFDLKSDAPIPGGSPVAGATDPDPSERPQDLSKEKKDKILNEARKLQQENKELKEGLALLMSSSGDLDENGRKLLEDQIARSQFLIRQNNRLIAGYALDYQRAGGDPGDIDQAFSGVSLITGQTTPSQEAAQPIPEVPSEPVPAKTKTSGGGKLRTKEAQEPPPLFSPWDGQFQRFEPNPDLPMLQSTRARPDWPQYLEWNEDQPYTYEDPNKSKEIQDLEKRLADLQAKRDALPPPEVDESFLENPYEPTPKKEAEAAAAAVIAERERLALEIESDPNLSGPQKTARLKKLYADTKIKLDKIESDKKKKLEESSKGGKTAFQDLAKTAGTDSERAALDDEINILSAQLETMRGSSPTNTFIDTIATELGVGKNEVITKLLGNEGMTFTQTDENGNKVGVRYKLKYNPDTKQLQIMYSTPKFVTSIDKARTAIGNVAEAKKFAIPFERDARIETNEMIMQRADAISAQMEKIRTHAEALNNRQVDPQRWMRNASLANQVGAMLYIVCSGLLAGNEGMDTAIKDINRLITQDIDLQIDKLDREKDYVKFLQDDVLNIEKEYKNKEAQIQAKYAIAYEKAIQAALRTPGADPAAVDMYVAEAELEAASRWVEADKLEKRDYTDLYKAPEAPKYGGGGSKKKDIAEEGWIIWNGRWISGDVIKAYPSLTESSAGRPSPMEKANRAGELEAIANELEANPDKYVTEIGGNSDKKNMRERAILALKQGSDESDRDGAASRIGTWTEETTVQGIKNIAARLRGIAASLRQQAVREARIPEDLGIPVSAWGGPGSGEPPPSMTGWQKKKETGDE